MIDPIYAGPWLLPTDLVRRECDSYIVEARNEEIWSLPTRCPPWTVSDLTVHLAATFHRFVELLRRTRSGETRLPFTPAELDAENLRAVAEFRGDPHATLCEEVSRFCELAADPAEPIIHQRGMVPVGLQTAWGLRELSVHHDDLAHACGRAYRPPEPVVDVVIAGCGPLSMGAPAPGEDRWAWVLRSSGR